VKLDGLGQLKNPVASSGTESHNCPSFELQSAGRSIKKVDLSKIIIRRETTGTNSR
jgi:hypothetical protein